MFASDAVKNAKSSSAYSTELFASSASAISLAVFTSTGWLNSTRWVSVAISEETSNETGCSWVVSAMFVKSWLDSSWSSNFTIRPPTSAFIGGRGNLTVDRSTVNGPVTSLLTSPKTAQILKLYDALRSKLAISNSLASLLTSTCRLSGSILTIYLSISLSVLSQVNLIPSTTGVKLKLVGALTTTKGTVTVGEGVGDTDSVTSGEGETLGDGSVTGVSSTITSLPTSIAEGSGLGESTGSVVGVFSIDVSVETTSVGVSSAKATMLFTGKIKAVTKPKIAAARKNTWGDCGTTCFIEETVWLYI